MPRVVDHDERREEILRDVDLAGVGELEHRRGLVPSGVLQDDDRMLARRLLKNGIETFLILIFERTF